MDEIKESILGLAIWALAERTGCTFLQARKAVETEFREKFATSERMTSNTMVQILHGAHLLLED